MRMCVRTSKRFLFYVNLQLNIHVRTRVPCRDPRGFAIKFYTEDGIWDLVANVGNTGIRITHLIERARK